MKIDANTITPLVQETFNNAISQSSDTEGDSFQAILEAAKASGDTEKLREVSNQLEGVFINMMMKVMRNTIPDSEGIFQKSTAEKMFQSMLDETYADKMAEAGGIGISDMIFDQMEKYLYNEEDENQGSSFEMKG
ncbi:MAG: rod-binding protein [Clostridia bacterium]|nr:rod-binding protein [Clostridia bacterium]